MLQYVFIADAFVGHHGRADLAQAYAVPPPCPVEREGGGDGICGCAFGKRATHDEGGTIQAFLAEGAADFQLFAERQTALAAHDAQQGDAAACAALQRLKVYDFAKIEVEPLAQTCRQFGLRQHGLPTVEVGRRGEVVVVEHLGEQSLLGGVAIGRGDGHDPTLRLCLIGEVGDAALAIAAHGLKIRDVLIVPAGAVTLGHAAATFRETRVAHLAFGKQHLAARGTHRLAAHLAGRAGSGQALITLAMVVGADVEEGVVLTVVPAHVLVVAAHEREETARCPLAGGGAAAQHLTEQPTARNDGVRLEQGERRGGFHLGGNDAREVFLGGNVVHHDEFLLVHDELQATGEGLLLLLFPVEVFADGHALECESGIGAIGNEREFAVNVAVPKYGSVAAFCFLLAGLQRALGVERAAEAEAHALGRHDAHAHLGFFVESRLRGGLLRGGAARCAGMGGAMYAAHGLQRFAFGEGYLAENIDCRFEGHFPKVFLARRDEQAAHVQGTGTYEHIA